ncbi:hypothetical protein [Bradyrhizobium sp. HKCCYLS20291]|uniref:hypothetical protein n=1 Tax=Bradyrhizobium sp. HKCCYLS20291 TaxID=3420766 RepID=UPI003EB9D36E
MVVAMLLGSMLSGCAGQGSSPSEQAAGANAAPTTDPLDDDVARLEAREKTLAPAHLQRRRQLIAELLEKNAALASGRKVALLNAELAGPKVIKLREWQNWLKPTTAAVTIYCARAKIDSALDMYVRRTALIVIQTAADGTETLRAGVQTSRGINLTGDDGTPLACYKMEGYAAFPELEQARASKLAGRV